MHIKTFSGPSVQDVLNQVKTELGTEAVIISSRDIERDGERIHEVTACVERSPESSLVPNNWEDWSRDWLRLRDHIYSLMHPAMSMERLVPRHRVALEFLQREGLEDSVAMELYQRMIARPEASVLDFLDETIKLRPWNSKQWPERLHIIAGPCGSGKTTAALRMALLLRQEDPSLKIAFINADCERSNGRLLLRHWAELSDFTYLEASDGNSMRVALRSCQEASRVFVDLPGLSNREGTLLDLLGMLGIQGMGAAIHLVLPPHYDTRQTKGFLNRYQTGLLSGLVLTKLDEASGFGTLLNTSMLTGLPISAISFGSAMKSSISPAENALLWRLVFKRQLLGTPTAAVAAPQNAPQANDHPDAVNQ